MNYNDDVNEFLSEGGVPAAKFENYGKLVKGTILAQKVEQVRDPKTGEMQWWDAQRTQPQKQLILTVQTDERDPAIQFDDGARRIFAKNNMLAQIRKAVRAAGGRIEVGGQIAVKFVGEGIPTTKGFSAPKLYECWYKPAPQGMSLEAEAGNPFEQEAPQMAPAMASTPQPAQGQRPPVQAAPPTSRNPFEDVEPDALPF